MNGTIGRLVALSATGLLALGGLAATPAHARTSSPVVDSDRDLMPDTNEDEDDALEPCIGDDADTDHDGIRDEDEDELGTNVNVADTDHDGTGDGDEDRDHDGRSNEDEDDHGVDACHHDGDHDGTEDEDEGDHFGTITSFDAQTGALVIATEADPVTVTVTSDTEIRYDDDAPAPAPATDHGTDDGGSIDDHGGRTTTDALVPGVGVAELEYHHGVLEEIELIAPAPTA